MQNVEVLQILQVLSKQKISRQTDSYLLTLYTCFNYVSIIKCIFASRFTTFDDKNWFVENFWKTAAQELPEYVNDFPQEETFFVNFLREPVDPTGDEDEDFSTDAPKIYEELPSLVFFSTAVVMY